MAKICGESETKMVMAARENGLPRAMVDDEPNTTGDYQGDCRQNTALEGLGDLFRSTYQKSSESGYYLIGNPDQGASGRVMLNVYACVRKGEGVEWDRNALLSKNGVQCSMYQAQIVIGFIAARIAKMPNLALVPEGALLLGRSGVLPQTDTDRSWLEHHLLKLIKEAKEPEPEPKQEEVVEE